MKIIFHLAIFCSLIYLKNGQVCQNPLLDINYNKLAPQNILNTPEKFSDLKYCSNLNNVKQCCFREDIEKLGEKFENFKQLLKNRDMFQTNEQNNLIQQNIQENFSQLEKNINDVQYKLNKVAEMKIVQDVMQAIDQKTGQVLQDKIEDIQSKLPSNYRSKEKANEFLQAVSKKYQTELFFSGIPIKQSGILDIFFNQNIFNGIYNVFVNPLNFNDLIKVQKESLKNMTKAKLNCFNQILKHQASMTCSICDLDYQSKKLSKINGKIQIELSKSVCQQVQEACYPFIKELINQNQQKKIQWQNQQVKEELKLIVNDVSNSNDIANFIIKSSNLLDKTTSGQQMNQVPANCQDQNQCNYICEEFLKPNGSNIEILFNQNQFSFILNNKNRRLLNEKIDQTIYSDNGFDSLSYAESTGLPIIYNYSSFDVHQKYFIKIWIILTAIIFMIL